MKQFMVVTLVEGNPHADFFNTMMEAEQYRQAVECGLGGAAQVYELVHSATGIEYRFSYE